MISPALRELFTKASHDSGFMLDNLQESLDTLRSSGQADETEGKELAVFLTGLIATANRLREQTERLSRGESATEEGVIYLKDFPDPYLVKDGSVYYLRVNEKDLCNSPLSQDGAYFHRDEFAEVYANDLMGQPEIDAIILALTPAAPDDADSAVPSDLEAVR